MEKSNESKKTQTFDLNFKGFDYNSVSSSSVSSSSIDSRIKALIENGEDPPSDSQPDLSSNSSSVLEFLIPENLMKLNESETFASSSPIFNKKKVDFSKFHSRFNETPKINLKIEGVGSEAYDQSYSSAEDIKDDLEAFDLNSHTLDSEYNLELDQAVVIDNDVIKSSSSESGEIFKDLIDECESPEKFKTDEFYESVGDSPPEIVHQVLSLLPDDLFEEKFKKDSDLHLKVERNSSRHVEKKEASEDDYEKNMIRNSLTDERRDKQKHEDSQGQCSCNKCYIQ